MKKPNKKRTWWTRALGTGAMLTVSAVASAGFLPSMSEKPMAAWAMVYGTEAPQQKPTMQLFGIMQPGYQYMQTEVPGKNTVTGASQFKFYRVRPGIRGSIGPNIDYYFLAQFDNNSPATSSASVLDGTVTLNYIPGVHVEVGQMIVPFADEGSTAAGVLPWINYSPATYNISYNDFTTNPAGNGIAGPTGNGQFNSARERGVMAFNQFRNGAMSLDYALGYFNDTGVSVSGPSMGHPDDLLGHVGVGLGPFAVAVGYEGGRQEMGPAPFASYQQKKVSLDVHYGNYAKDPFWLWYEYQHASDTQQPGANGDGLARGWFGAAGVRPAKHVMAVLRYSAYNSENVVMVTPTLGGPGPVASYAFSGAGVATSLNQESLVGVYLARKGVRYYLELDHTTFNNTGAPAANAVSVMLSVPFGARLLP